MEGQARSINILLQCDLFQDGLLNFAKQLKTVLKKQLKGEIKMNSCVSQGK